MTLLQLRVLLAVAEQGGFTAAAERIGMSQPAVSRAVAALESELGTTLLARHRDGVTLTEAGRRAVSHAEVAIRHFDLLRSEVAAVAGQVTGTLRVASLPTATALVAGQLRTFTDRYPQVRVRLFEGSDTEVREWLGQGAADVGVVTLPAAGLRTVPLDTHEMVAVLPVDHPFASQPLISIAALAGEPFIFPTGGCGAMIIEAARGAGVRLDNTLEARETSAILEMVAAGFGVSVLPSLGLPAELGAVAIRPLDPPAPRTLAVALGTSTGTTVAQAFLDHVAARTEQPGLVAQPG